MNGPTKGIRPRKYSAFGKLASCSLSQLSVGIGRSVKTPQTKPASELVETDPSTFPVSSVRSLRPK